MKSFFAIALAIPTALLIYFSDLPQRHSDTSFSIFQKAHAIFGVRRRSHRRGFVVGAVVGASAATAANASVDASSQPQEKSAPKQPSDNTGDTTTTPVGTVVSKLPEGCSKLLKNGVEYQQCGSSYYRAAFQGNNLVYVSTVPD